MRETFVKLPLIEQTGEILRIKTGAMRRLSGFILAIAWMKVVEWVKVVMLTQASLFAENNHLIRLK